MGLNNEGPSIGVENEGPSMGAGNEGPSIGAVLILSTISVCLFILSCLFSFMKIIMYK